MKILCVVLLIVILSSKCSAQNNSAAPPPPTLSAPPPPPTSSAAVPPPPSPAAVPPPSAPSQQPLSAASQPQAPPLSPGDPQPPISSSASQSPLSPAAPSSLLEPPLSPLPQNSSLSPASVEAPPPPPPPPVSTEQASVQVNLDEEDRNKSTNGTGCLHPAPEKSQSNPMVRLEFNASQFDKTDQQVIKVHVNKFYGVVRDNFYIQNMEGLVLSIKFREGEPTTQATIRGSTEDDWNSEYVLAKADAFWSNNNEHGAQHAINNITYPFEIQLVHYRKDLNSLAAAANTKHGVLVLSFLFEGAGQENLRLAPLVAASWRCVFPFPPEEFRLAHGPFNIKTLFPVDLTNMQYTGLYYVQPCSCEAKFVVFMYPGQIGFKQLNELRNMRTSTGKKIRGGFTNYTVNQTVDKFVQNVKLVILPTEENNYSVRSTISTYLLRITIFLIFFTNKYIQSS